MTFDGFNELDSFVALTILNRIRLPEWKAEIVSPADTVRSMNGVLIKTQKPLSFVNEADAVLFGSGIHTQKLVENKSIMSQLSLSPKHQLIGSQCSGALFLHHLGLIDGISICTDTKTRPFMEKLGVTITDKPFKADGNVATAGGCLSSQYLAMWVIYRAAGLKKAEEVIRYIAPIGQEDEYVSRAIETLGNDTK